MHHLENCLGVDSGVIDELNMLHNVELIRTIGNNERAACCKGSCSHLSYPEDLVSQHTAVGGKVFLAP